MEIGAQQSELIQRLLLEAGRIMENSAPELALSLPESPDDVCGRVNRLTKSASTLLALATAAEALLEPIVGNR